MATPTAEDRTLQYVLPANDSIRKANRSIAKTVTTLRSQSKGTEAGKVLEDEINIRREKIQVDNKEYLNALKQLKYQSTAKGKTDLSPP